MYCLATPYRQGAHPNNVKFLGHNTYYNVCLDIASAISGGPVPMLILPSSKCFFPLVQKRTCFSRIY